MPWTQGWPQGSVTAWPAVFSSPRCSCVCVTCGMALGPDQVGHRISVTSNGLVATGVGAQVLCIQHADGLHALLTEGWGWWAGSPCACSSTGFAACAASNSRLRAVTPRILRALILARAVCRRARPTREVCGHSAPEAERVFHL
jgi:hypothetical protein